MTELRLASRARLIVIALALVAGLAVGLWVAWIAWPVQVTNVDVTDLAGTATLIATTAPPTLTPTPTRTETRPPTLTLTPTLTLMPTAMRTPTRATTRVPTRTATRPPTLTRTSTPTLMPTAALTPTRTATARPPATATPIPAPVATTQWLPSFPSEWPGGAAYQSVAASVTPGQKYWHLAKAIFCDLNDKHDYHDYCMDLPGGPQGTSIYIKLIDASGNRINAPLLIDGNVSNEEQKSAGDMCDCNYTFITNSSAIQIGGAPSDKISGLSLPSNYHVRYFLTFQLITR